MAIDLLSNGCRRRNFSPNCAILHCGCITFAWYTHTHSCEPALSRAIGVSRSDADAAWNNGQSDEWIGPLSCLAYIHTYLSLWVVYLWVVGGERATQWHKLIGWLPVRLIDIASLTLHSSYIHLAPHHCSIHHSLKSPLIYRAHIMAKASIIDRSARGCCSWSVGLLAAHMIPFIMMPYTHLHINEYTLYRHICIWVDWRKSVGQAIAVYKDPIHPSKLSNSQLST